MKTFAAIAVLALISGSRADVTCDDCLTFGGAMLDYLMSDASIAEQTEIIVANVCPGAEDPAGCEAGMRAWWSGIAMAMYPVFLEPNDVCMQLGACAIKTLTGEPTCDECVGSSKLLLVSLDRRRRLPKL